MSFVDLATLTTHRRNELEARLSIFWEKCDRAVDDIKKLKMKTQGLVLQLNCDPSELKERFLSSMKQLDEYMYLMTDFNISISKLDEEENIDYTPVQDSFSKPLMPLAPPAPFNLIDALSEPAPSTSTSCSNYCPPEKPKRVKTPKADQALIVFSSTSSSEETVPQGKSGMVVKEVQCELEAELSNVKIEDPPSPITCEAKNLPAQQMLETDHVYNATIMHTDGSSFWVITEDPEEVQNLMIEMTNFYSENHKDISRKEVKALTCCAFYDEESECYYRGLFLNMKDQDDDSELTEIYVVDTGETRSVPIECVQPLYPRYCSKPPYARLCHLAGVDLISYNKNLMEKQKAFMMEYVGKQCNIEIDDNVSESYGVYVVLLPSGETLNKIIVHQGLALAIDKPVEEVKHSPEKSASSSKADFEITDCPEYEDPVEAVTGYRNRDEMDICKHYKGEPEKKCFKGNRCNKKHIRMHPDGWTLDRVPVLGKCKSLPLPAPDTWLRVLVTYICHYDRIYVQLVAKERQDPDIPSFGVVLPPTTLPALLIDMNSAATRVAYKPLTETESLLAEDNWMSWSLIKGLTHDYSVPPKPKQITPAPGELVAALYPLDNNWYRARVLSITRSDQSVEVIYVDYGTTLWVREDQLRLLEPRHVNLPMQAVRCVLAGVRARSRQSQQWAQAKMTLKEMVLDKELDAHVIARDYDEISVELFDEEGYSIAEQLAANGMVELTEYNIVDDSDVTRKIVVP